MGSRAFALVVSFNPATNTAALNSFRATYGVPPSVPIFGPYRGKLDNGGEEIELQRPDPPQVSGPDAGFVPYVLADRVEYDDMAPWPLTADGGGASLQRRRPYDYGNDPVNWKGDGPTAGRPNVSGSTYTDSDGDGISDSWETANGLSASNRSDADQDFDGDGRYKLIFRPISQLGGRPRHEVQFETGYYNNGYGARLQGNWRSGTTVESSTGDLKFSPYFDLDFRLFANLSENFDLVSKHPFFRGASVRFDVENIFNNRPKVRDISGDTPLSYQPDLLEPID